MIAILLSALSSMDKFKLVLIDCLQLLTGQFANTLKLFSKFDIHYVYYIMCNLIHYYYIKMNLS